MPIMFIMMSGCTEDDTGTGPEYSLIISTSEIRDTTPGPVPMDATEGNAFLYIEVEMGYHRSDDTVEIWPGHFDIRSVEGDLIPGRYFMDEDGDSFNAIILSTNSMEVFWLVFEIDEASEVEELIYGEHGLLDDPVSARL